MGSHMHISVHGKGEDDAQVVSSAVTKDQLEEFKARAKALLKS